MRIRAAEPGDVAAITAIYRDAVLHGTGTFEIVPPDEIEMGARRSAIVAAGYSFLIAEEQSILGYAYAASFRAREGFRPVVENSVYVDEHARGRGIATALLKALIKEAEARGFRQMIAVIGDSANAASIAVHERCGFVRTGFLPSVGWKAERWLDIVTMQRALGPGDNSPAT